MNIFDAMAIDGVTGGLLTRPYTIGYGGRYEATLDAATPDELGGLWNAFADREGIARDSVTYVLEAKREHVPDPYDEGLGIARGIVARMKNEARLESAGEEDELPEEVSLAREESYWEEAFSACKASYCKKVLSKLDELGDRHRANSPEQGREGALGRDEEEELAMAALDDADTAALVVAHNASYEGGEQTLARRVRDTCYEYCAVYLQDAIRDTVNAAYDTDNLKKKEAGDMER